MEAPKSQCSHRKELMRRYSEATVIYADLVKQLTDIVGVIEREKYLHLKALAEDARVVSELARISYEKHLIEHECQEPEAEERISK